MLQRLDDGTWCWLKARTQKSDNMWTGKTDTLKRFVFPDVKVPASLGQDAARVSVKGGNYVVVDIASASHSTLVANPLARTMMQEYVRALEGVCQEKTMEQ